MVEVRRARRMDREGVPVPMSAGAAPPANELTSITPQLMAIGLHFPYRVTHTRSTSGRAAVGSGQLPAQPAEKQREVGKCREDNPPHLSQTTAFFKIWNCQENFQQVRLLCGWMGGVGVRSEL